MAAGRILSLVLLLIACFERTARAGECARVLLEMTHGVRKVVLRARCRLVWRVLDTRAWSRPGQAVLYAMLYGLVYPTCKLLDKVAALYMYGLAAGY